MKRAYRSIAIVDDAAVDRRFAMRAIRRCLPECEVHAFASATAFDEALASGTRPDAVIVDLNMPGLDGMTWMRRRARELAAAGCRVVTLTTSSDPADAEAARAAGASEVGVKPANLAALTDVIAALLDLPRE